MQDQAPFRISAEPTRVELVAKYFRGLGDETRLAILNLLEAEELAVSEISRRLGVEQTSVSKHLQCLRWCGYVTTRRDHRTIYNRIADERVSQILHLANELLSLNAEHVEACDRIDPQGIERTADDTSFPSLWSGGSAE